MNIFYLNQDPEECAKQHVDKHVVKMIVEYAQLLSTAHRVLDGKQETIILPSGRKKKAWILSDDREQILYKSTHVNHPSVIWVRQNEHNYSWLYSLWIYLIVEYNFRYGKMHKTAGLIEALEYLPTNIPESKFTEPTPAMPEQYRSVSSVDSYRAYYLAEKSHMFVWSHRSKPDWVQTS